MLLPMHLAITGASRPLQQAVIVTINSMRPNDVYMRQ